MPPPSNVGQVRTFLGMVAYVRKFIPKCGELIAPLTELTQSKRKFLWTPERDHAFQTLKEKLCSAPILQFPNRNRQYELETDASDRAIGGVLRVEIDSGEFLPVA